MESIAAWDDVSELNLATMQPMTCNWSVTVYDKVAAIPEEGPIGLGRPLQ